MEGEQQALTLNTKEYIASEINMDIQSDNTNFTTTFNCIINRSDSFSNVGWINKPNHDPIGALIHN